MPNASEWAGEVRTGKCMSGDLGEHSGFAVAEVEAGVKEMGSGWQVRKWVCKVKFRLFKKVDFEATGESDS